MWREVVERGEGRAGAREVEGAEWIRAVDVTDRARVERLLDHGKIDLGEAEAIGLALEHKDALLIVDEGRVRKFARSLGLTVVGAVGVLIQARQRKLVDDLRTLVDDMRRNGIRIGDVERDAAARVEIRLAAIEAQKREGVDIPRKR